MNKIRSKGLIAWMVNNSVAVNILLIILIVGGAIQLFNIKQEIFPEFTLDIVSVSISYPGASPKEVETGILLAVEEAVRGIDGVKHVNTTATEGLGIAFIEVMFGSNTDKVTNDIKSAIDQIRTFPKDAEKPITKRISARSEVISLILYGDASEADLRAYAEMVRDDLLQNDKITLVELSGIRDREINIEIPKEELSSHRLTLGQIARKLGEASVEIPAGQLKTKEQDLNLRTSNRLEFAEEYADVVIKNSNFQEELKLKDLANISDTFENLDKASFYDGKPAVMVRVLRSGEQKPTEIAKEVKKYNELLVNKLPKNISSAIWNDYANLLSQRMELLYSNALQGLFLVFLLLAMFLEIRLAFWVTMGIPASFFGTFLLLPFFGISINMISLFALIITLGMVVDDAIVIGENIYAHRESGEPLLKASIIGTKEVYVPVVFAILTTMAAFSALFFVPGIMGKFFFVIPTLVILVLSISLMESLLMLPNHLAHASKGDKDKGFLGYFNKKQQVFSIWFMRQVEKFYRPFVTKAVENRYITVAIALGLLIFTIGLIKGGRLQFTFFPKIDSEIVLLSAQYDVGTPIKSTQELQKKLLKAAEMALISLGGKEKAKGFYSQLGSAINPGGPDIGPNKESGGHMLNIMVQLVCAENRNFSSDEFTKAWAKELGEIPGLKTLTFKSTNGPDAGKALSLSLKHKNMQILEGQAVSLAKTLHNYKGLYSIEDGIAQGREQLEFKLKDKAHSLGISTTDLGLQIRNAFYGAEAVRRQRDRDEIKVMVRLPKEQRESLYDIENFKIQTMQDEVLLHEIADVKRNASYAQIKREDGNRLITVSADVMPGEANANEIMADLEKNIIPQMLKDTPGLIISHSGEQREQKETVKSMGLGFLFALLAIYALLAIPLKSYSQPLIVMSAIPFGIIGATIGHAVMGFDLSIISLMGIVALSGIVVNDSLVFIHAANERGGQSLDAKKIIIEAGIKRFRPIMLTSLTTFLGVIPTIMETSMQARWLVPMATSIGFGVVFSTFVTLVLVPALYIIILDIKSLKIFKQKVLLEQ